MQRLNATFEFVEKIIYMQPSELIVFLKSCNKTVYRFIQEIFKNYLIGTFNVPEFLTNRLKKFKDFIRKITKKSFSFTKKYISTRLINIILEILPYAKSYLNKLVKHE